MESCSLLDPISLKKVSFSQIFECEWRIDLVSLPQNEEGEQCLIQRNKFSVVGFDAASLVWRFVWAWGGGQK